MTKDLSVEELKTMVGHLMLDLRGNWAYAYSDRIEEVISLLELLIEKDPENSEEYTEDLETAKEELEDPHDGRIFRDMCEMYGYGSDEGKTKSVHDYLEEILTHPEYHQIDISNE